MPRQARIDSPGLLHHVIARGNEKRKLFLTPGDYCDFLARLARLLPQTDNQCFTWALMPNHIHLLLRSGARGISNLLHRLLGGYAITFNLRYKRVGHLFQNRFKSIICEDEPYFLQLVRYIALNPVRAGLVRTIEELRSYPWTGHPALMGNINLAWQSTTETLAHWGDDLSLARDRYEQFLREGLHEGYRDDLEGGGLLRSLGGVAKVIETRASHGFEAGDVRILGSSEFVQKVLGNLPKKEEPSSKRVSIEEIMQSVSEVTGVSSAEIYSPSRSLAASKAKAIFIHRGVCLAGKTLRELARLTHMSGSAATRARRRGEQLWGRNELTELIVKEVR